MPNASKMMASKSSLSAAMNAGLMPGVSFTAQTRSLSASKKRGGCKAASRPRVVRRIRLVEARRHDDLIPSEARDKREIDALERVETGGALLARPRSAITFPANTTHMPRMLIVGCESETPATR